MAMKKYATVEDYFADYSGTHLELMYRIRDLILEEEPQAKAAISYGMPSYVKDGVIGGFYAYKNHVSYYPHEAGIIEKYADELESYKISKGTIQIKLEQEFPDTVLRKVILEKISINMSNLLG